MAGKRLLDAALVLGAAKTVAKQHFRIRGEQLGLWNQTSSIAKAVKNQTDRVTVTVSAAAALARRLNENPPGRYYTQASKASEDDTIPRKETVAAETDAVKEEALQQDHHYERSPRNAAQQAAPHEDLELRQKQAARTPTPDGTIPPTGAPIDTGGIDADTYGERSGHRKHAPLSQDQDSQDDNIIGHASQDSTIAKPSRTSEARIPSHDAVPEQESSGDINTDVFHSPKIAEMLTGRGKMSKQEYEMRLKKARGTPLDDTPPALGHDQDTFNVRQAGSGSPSDKGEAPLNKSHTKMDQHREEDVRDLAADLAKEVHSVKEMRESRVPSSRFGRIWQYAGLGTSMAFGAVGETLRRATGTGSEGSLMLSPANMERLVAKLSRMRGAALKLGQMMSFQDSKMLPKPIHDVLQRVQDNADYMPPSQRNKVLSANLGSEWKDLFSSFDDVPIAAASIGQVHKAVLASTGTPVAVKIQYPGVATSISSDLNNLSLLLTASRLLPKGLFLDKTIANARVELAWECDYERERTYQTQFRELLADETPTFTVPRVIEEACGPQVLTAEFMNGKGVTKDSLNLTQEQRDWIGTNILRLCLRELTEFRLMQTDPNWTNFLFNASTNKLELLDFGAAREFPTKFIDPYVRILLAGSEGDRETIRKLSIELGYLTGAESSKMLKAHIDSVLTLAEPFQTTKSEGDMYDFRDQTITDRVRGFIPVMIKERLAPPPEETYSLHRKLSGAFLLLARLGSRVKCRELFVDATNKWRQRKGLQ
ncbi:hypothetical protein FH972_025712 [Carpinus fangiana]|uniref:ABC1 atypical kinase-like domain-containing protein n=1 Tax=Carpinus fangiana TaxID=176857 RepID=A0A5N6L281_9ROSI|nr:hypothetical protein FH972_025712 [Carpinus fangiana]